MIISFQKLAKEEERLAGGKGRILSKLFRMGYRVPDGFIILPEAFVDDELTMEACAQVWAQLVRLRRESKEKTFVVRSSVLCEDTAMASFASEFESVLDVDTDEEIRQAIHFVRRSRHSASVRTFNQEQALPATEHELAVVVQCLIRAEYSGVLFTVDPVTGDQMRMTGNFIQGLGEDQVSGRATPQTFTLARPKGTYSGPVELEKPVRALYRNACELEKDLGSAQEIKWACAGGRLYILQARPITTLSGYKADTAEWNDSLTGNFLWLGTSMVENAPHVLTPFSCSLRKGLVYNGVDFCDSSSLGVDGYPMLGIISGRGYINLSILVSASRPFFGGDTRKTLQQASAWWGGTPQDVEVPLVPISTWAWWTKVLPSLSRFVIKMAHLRKKIPQFVGQNLNWCAVMTERIHQIENPAELAALWREEIAPYSNNAFFLANAGVTGLPNRLESVLGEMVGKEDANALLSNLSGLSSPLGSLGPLTDLDKVARGEMSREEYMKTYGHRGMNENEYAWPRPLEDPNWIEQQLEEFTKTPLDIDVLFTRQQAAYTETWERFCERYPRKVKQMRLRLKKAALAAQQWEMVRSEAARSAAVIRTFARRAGALTTAGENVFYLTVDEVLAVLEGDDLVLQSLPMRKETYDGYRALPPYPTIIAGRFDPHQWAADPLRRSDIFNASVPDRATAADTNEPISGFTGAFGIVEGSVRCVDCLENNGHFQVGEILVTTSTNIGWTLLFPRAAAIVTDVGTPQSHAAIAARELGIPAVVGCGNATMRLKTGDRVRVNGGQGLVEILEAARKSKPRKNSKRKGIRERPVMVNE